MLVLVFFSFCFGFCLTVGKCYFDVFIVPIILVRLLTGSFVVSYIGGIRYAYRISISNEQRNRLVAWAPI